MARRPDFGKHDFFERKDLDELGRNLAMMSEAAVRDFYQHAYRECRIINGRTFPSARSIQSLVQAWKQLRKWRS
jgi:nitrogen regulatory protein PII-like uncharacterized protein